MKNFKQEKGITLIALIITIVVLLILAGVAIGTLEQSNIIGRAKEAAGSYNQAKDDETDELSSAEALLEKYSAENNGADVGGVKAYKFGEQISILTPDNEIVLYLSENEMVPIFTERLTEEVTGYNITFTGFSDEEKSKIKLFTGDGFDLGAIVAYIGDDRNKAYMGMIPQDSTNVEISKSVYIEHNEDLLDKYYHDDSNVEYYYGKWDEFTRGNVTRSAGEGVYKVDYNNNTVTIYGRGTNDSWEKMKFNIENRGTNPTDINVTLDGEPLTIKANALKFEFLLHSDYYVICYFQDEKMYVDIDSKIVDGKELTSGYHAYNRVKYINTSDLPE